MMLLITSVLCCVNAIKLFLFQLKDFYNLENCEKVDDLHVFLIFATIKMG